MRIRDSFAGAAENPEPALLHQHTDIDSAGALLGARRLSQTKPCPIVRPTNQPDGPTPRKLLERDRDREEKEEEKENKRKRERENKRNTRR